MTLRVVAFVPHPPAGASSRLRVYDMVEPLARRGIDVRVRPFLDEAGYAGLYRPGGVWRKAGALARGSWRRWRDLVGPPADVALVHREVWPLVGDAPLERLRRHHPRWVFDFDDAVWIPNVSEANRSFVRMKPFDHPAKLVRGAAAISAGNAWLAAWALRERPGGSPEDVGVVPTSVDVRRWSPRPRVAGPPRLVWIGTHSTVRYLEPWIEPIRRVARRVPDLELHLIGGELQAPGVRVVRHPWSYEREVDLVALGDVGLAPVPDTDWARGKCGSKLLLYMALGIPALASPVGVHEEIVQHGTDGLFTRTSEEVEEGLQLLLDSRRRECLGRAARQRVEETYARDRVVPRLEALLRRAAESS